MSRPDYPKQLLPLAAEETMLQQTSRRVGDPTRFAPPLLVCSNEHRFLVAEQMRAIGVEPEAIVLEPVGRNTAPAPWKTSTAGDSRGVVGAARIELATTRV